MRRRLVFSVILAAAPAIAGADGAPYLVQDTSPGTDFTSFYGGVNSLRSLGDRLLFVGASDESLGVWSLEPGRRSAELLSAAEGGFAVASAGAGFLLWSGQEESERTVMMVSDGTPAGTFEVARGPYRYIPYGVDPRISAPLGGQVFYRGYEAATGWEPWITDGSPEGTRQLVDLELGPGDSSPSGFRVVGTGVCFRAETQFDGAFVACSDGTTGGTHRVTPPGFDLPYVDRSAVAGGQRLVFAAEHEYPDSSTDLYATSGTASSTVRILDLPTGGSLWSDLIELDGRIYFVADDVVHGQELWVTDGTSSGTRRVSEFGYAFPFNSLRGSEDVTTVGQNVVFFATDGLGPTTLWRSNGSPSSTRRAAEAREGCDGPADALSSVGSRIVYAERCDGSGYELRALDLSNGTVATLADICPGECDGGPRRPVRVGAYTLFEAGPWDDRELYVTDGTAAGTWRVSDVSEGGTDAGVLPWLPVWHDGRFWFPGRSRDTGSEIYSTGLHPSETRLETDLVSGAIASAPLQFSPVDGGVAYWRCSGWSVALSWSRGDVDDVVDLATFPGDCYEPEAGQPAISLNGRALMVRRAHGLQLWSTDGTIPGTVRLLDQGGYNAWSPIAEDQGVAWWLRFDYDRVEIWRTDGTPAGTRMDSAVPPGLSAIRVPPTAAGGLVFFVAEDSNYEVRAVVYDPATRQFEVLAAHLPSWYSIQQDRPFFARTGNSVYFLGLDYPDRMLWRFDLEAGSLASALPIFAIDVSLVGAHGWALLLTREPDSTMVLHRSDGNALVTLASLGTIPNHGGDLDELEASAPVVAGRWLLFRTRTQERGLELWATDGTAEGTFAAPEAWVGPGSSVPSPPVVEGEAAYFAASEPLLGRELYRLDLVSGALARLSDVAPGARTAQIAEVAVAGGRLFFGADDGLHGNELWALNLDEQGCLARPHDLCLNQDRFQLSAYWRDFFGNSGDGAAVPLTSDTGYFWFFDPANVEAVIKVLDAIGVNQRYWVFYGALSNVEYSIDVVDTATRIKRRYYNPPGRYASIGDVDAFDPFGLATHPPYNEIEAAATDGRPILIDALFVPQAASGSCVPSDLRLCLQQERFAVEATWRDFQGNSGVGTAVPLSSDTGYFWFFNNANVEAVIKVLDGRPVNDKFWVYYGALSNVEYTLTVTDTWTGAVKQYLNPSGRFASVGDNNAF